MNILIRKNFNAETSSKDRNYNKMGGRHRKSHGGVHGTRQRESVFCPIDEHNCTNYRTHLFLNPANSMQDIQDDSPANMSTPNKSTNAAFASYQSSFSKSDYPLAPSDFNLNRKVRTQVSFEDQNALCAIPGFKTNCSNTITTTEPSIRKVEHATATTLANLDRDCFIIPLGNIERFLPPGVPVPLTGNLPNSLNVLEIEDPKLVVTINLMSHMEPIEPLLESPLSSPLMKQKQLAMQLIQDIAISKTATEGMLLANLEKGSAFPFIAYYIVNKNQTMPVDFYQFVRKTTLTKFDPQIIRYTTAHTFDIFNEVATIARPPLQTTSKRPKSNTTGYIVTIYKVFDGDDREQFEKNWLYWSGARMIYKYLAKSVGLRRITLHKSQLTGDKLYLLIVECSNFLDDFSSAAVLLPSLRARLCGYTGIYRSVSVF